MNFSQQRRPCHFYLRNQRTWSLNVVQIMFFLMMMVMLMLGETQANTKLKQNNKLVLCGWVLASTSEWLVWGRILQVGRDTRWGSSEADSPGYIMLMRILTSRMSLVKPSYSMYNSYLDNPYQTAKNNFMIFCLAFFSNSGIPNALHISPPL